MKKIITLIAIALVLVTCSKEDKNQNPIVEPEVLDKDAVVLSFSSKKPQTENDTKTAWDSETSSIVWSTGDRIKVGYTLDGVWMAKDGAADFISEPKVPAKFYASNNVSIDGTHANVGTFSVPTGFTNSPSGDAIFYAVYPQSCIGGNDSEFAPSLTVNVKPSQTPGVNTFDKDADIMVGHTEAQTLTGTFPTTPMALTWNRIVAHADLTFTNLAVDGDNSVKKITLTFNDEAKVAGSFYVDVTNGAITNIAGSKNVIELVGTNLSINTNSIKAWASIIPVTFTSLTVKIKTDVATYTRTISGLNKTFKKNARNTLSVNMSSAERTVNTTLLDNGNYVLAVKSGDDYVAISSAANGSSARRDEVQITTANFDPSDYSTISPYTAANNLIWTITNVTGGVKINLVGDVNSYMQYGSNTLPLGVSGAVFEVEEGTGTYTFENSSRFISRNGTIGFGCYSSGSYLKDFYVIPATGTPTLTFAETSKNVAADVPSVTFSYTDIFLTDAPTVSVTSDVGGAVASPSIAAGTLTVNLNENTTASAKTVTLTVTATGATPVVLTINQAAAMANASNGDILWAEGFSGFSTNAVPSESNASTTVYGSGSVTYACTSEGTKVYSGTLCGGVTPELIVAKNGGSFTVTGIPTGNVTSMTLTFKSNNGCTVSTNTTGASIGSNLGTGSTYTYEVTVTSGTKRVNLTFTNSDTENNTRIDDLSLVAGAPVAGITVTTGAASSTSSAAGTTATLNGTITLVNGAVIGNVTEAGFYYKLTSAGSYTKVTLESAPATTSFSKALTGLTKGSEYTYYAYAIYNSGSEVNGTPVTFTPTQTGSSTTVDVTISSYATANSWTSGTMHTSVSIDGNITASKSGTGTNSGNYYTSSPAGWRFYESEASTCYFTISASGTHTIESVTVEYNNKNNGTLIRSSTNIESGTKVDVNASSISFTVGRTSGSNYGQVAISKITVKYN